MATMLPPEVQSSVTGKVPKYVYTARAIKLAAREEMAPKGYKRTVIQAEIIAPDIIEDAADPDKTKYSVAGRKFKVYLPIDPISKQFNDSYNAFGRLGYKNPDGSINLDKFWEDVEAGAFAFRVQLSSEEDVVKDGAGKPILGRDNRPISRGWNIAFVQPNDIIDRELGIEGGPTSGAPY